MHNSAQYHENESKFESLVVDVLCKRVTVTIISYYYTRYSLSSLIILSESTARQYTSPASYKVQLQFICWYTI